eukprot:449547-Rhodomonas_salina.1
MALMSLPLHMNALKRSFNLKRLNLFGNDIVRLARLTAVVAASVKVTVAGSQHHQHCYFQATIWSRIQTTRLEGDTEMTVDVTGPCTSEVYIGSPCTSVIWKHRTSTICTGHARIGG